MLFIYLLGILMSELTGSLFNIIGKNYERVNWWIMKEKIIEMIPCVNATDMPSEVTDYCVDNEISTHYQNDVAFLGDDGNPFSEWLKKNGYIFKTKYDSIGVIAT